jgi:ubiquitin C-terminal hydrolase
MGKKSAKKRRLAENRLKELDKLRGVSLLDSATPEPGEKQKPSNGGLPQNTQANPSDSGRLPRQRVEFVLPRALGKTAQTYIFDKQKKGAINEELPTIQEEDEGAPGNQEKKLKKNETIDDILFPRRKRKLEQEFESIHKQNSKKPAPDLETSSRGKNTAIISGGVFMLTPGTDEPDRVAKQVDKNNHRNKKEKNGEKQPNLASKSRCMSDPSIPSIPCAGGHLSGLSVEEAVKDKYGLRPRANSTDGELNLPQRGLCDERMILEAHRWSRDQNYVHQVVPKGFVNLGNTCFLNATLQCLAYLPPFCQSLLAISETKMRQNKKSKKKPTQGQRVTATLSSLFQRIHSFSEADRGGAIAPQSIVKALPTLGTCGSRNGYKFRPGRQEDAHEFLVHLLDAMHDGELIAAGINQQNSGWRDKLPVPRLDETTFIHRVFGGYFRSQVRCTKCGYRSNTYDPFLDLSLEVSKKSSRSILHSLSDFTRKETLDSDNQWRCSGCEKYVRATKQLTVFRPPLSLCVQLKRFTFDVGFGGRGFSSYGTGGLKYGKRNNRFGGGGSGKITKPIEFPAELELPLSDSRSCEYALTGLVIHVGGSASSGHYTAYVKKPGRKGADQWYHVDDSFVEVVPEKSVLRQKDAYLLFYCRKEVKLEFPSPPPRGMSADEAVKVGRARAKARVDSMSMEEPKQRRPSEENEENIGTNLPSPKLMVGSDRTSLERTKTAVHPLSSPQASKKELASKPSESSSPSSDELSDNDSSRSDELPDNDLDSLEPEPSNDKVEEYGSDSSDSDFDPTQPANVESDTDSSTRERPGASEDGAISLSLGKNASSSANHESGSESSSSEEEMDSKVKKQGYGNQKNSTSNSESDEESSSSKEMSSSESDDADDSSDSQPNPPHTAKEKATSSREQKEASPTAKKRELQQGKQQETNRTRVVVGRKDSRGKIQVMLGPRKKKMWKSKVATVGAKGAAFDLLGNLSVSKWGNEEDSKPKSEGNKSIKSEEEVVSQERERIVKKISKQEKSRKRKHHLDRWDAQLDLGRVRI